MIYALIILLILLGICASRCARLKRINTSLYEREARMREQIENLRDNLSRY